MLFRGTFRSGSANDEESCILEAKMVVPIPFSNIASVLIPSLTPVLPSQMTPPQGPQLPLPFMPRDPSSSSNLFGRLVLPAAAIQDPQVTAATVKMMRVLEVLNPVPPRVDPPLQGQQRAIVVNRDEAQPKSEKSQTEEFGDIEVHKGENEGLTGREQSSRYQNPEQSTAKDKNDASGQKSDVVANLEQPKAEVIQKGNQQIQPNPSSDQPGQLIKTSQDPAATAFIPTQNAEKAPKSSEAVPKKADEGKVEIIAQRPGIVEKRDVPEINVAAIVPEDSEELSKEIEKRPEKISEASRKENSEIPDRPHPHEAVDRPQVQVGAEDQQAHNIHPTLDDHIAIAGWLGMLPMTQQLEEQRLRREGKNSKLNSAVRMVPYRLSDIVFMLLAAAIGGCRTLIEFVQFIEKREKWFIVVLGPSCSIPSRELIWRLLSTIKESNFQHVFRIWLDEVCGQLREGEGKPVLPAIAVWQTPLGLIYGQAPGSDHALGRQAISQILQIFSFDETIVLTKVSETNIDLARSLERARARFIVEIDSDSAQAAAIDKAVERAANDPHPKGYQFTESYVEGVDRLLLQTLRLGSSSQLTLGLSVARIPTAVKLQSQSFVRGAMNSIDSYYISNLEQVDHGFFDLYRLQQPLNAKVNWILNCLFPIRPFSEAMQQCNSNITSLRRYAVELLRLKNGVLSVDEKMQRAASNGDELLGYITR